jgi:hypothetical protein
MPLNDGVPWSDDQARDSTRGCAKIVAIPVDWEALDFRIEGQVVLC